MDDSASPPSAQSAWKESVIQAELDAGRRMDLVSTSPYAFGATFPSWREPWIVQNGSEPVIDWTSYTPGIIKGAKDSTLAVRADALEGVRLAGDAAVRTGHGRRALASTSLADELQGRMDPRPQHLRRAGASNVAWVWCPSAACWANGTALQWYPGSQYVDSVCAQGATVTPRRLVRLGVHPVRQAAAALGKPMMISSFGVSEARRRQGAVDHRRLRRAGQQAQQHLSRGRGRHRGRGRDHTAPPSRRGPPVSPSRRCTPRPP